MKQKIGEVLAEINLMKKEAFIPNPYAGGGGQGGQPQQGGGSPQSGGQQQPSGGQQPPQQPPQGQGAGGQPQGGQQPGQGGGQQDIQAILSQLPPEVQQQLSQLPPDQMQQAIQQLLGGQGGQSGQGEDTDGDGMADSEKLHAKQTQSSGAPTDLENSTVTLRLRDLLDLISGGKATKSTLQVQEHHAKMQQKQQQMQQKADMDAQKKQQEQQMQQQMQSQGPNMMSGGIY